MGVGRMVGIWNSSDALAFLMIRVGLPLTAMTAADIEIDALSYQGGRMGGLIQGGRRITALLNGDIRWGHSKAEGLGAFSPYCEVLSARKCAGGSQGDG